ncbi:gliding motility-associated C-terminal domain-containing protein [Carboxylicivirga sp. N1Y90]|uniref:T9SS type B sorting domain-containing protein n=1 Tax=Carboxylicivirga fragile TaxID=3417571 RepID=UPI003D337642|nr:gliding motility-associated C-terminal domain-containing protein [Marinilabiliaceae bacterium N1Y90]
MKMILRFRLLMFLGLMLLVSSANAQSSKSIKNDIRAIHKYLGYSSPVLKGGEVGNPIPSLEAEYCSTDGSDDVIVPDKSALPPAAVDIQWEIVTNIAGEGVMLHPGWGDVLGTGTDTYLRFHPDRVDARYLNNATIYIVMTPLNGAGVSAGGGLTDWTLVYKTATPYDLSSNVPAICAGSDAILTLSNSESGYGYQLMVDGAPTQGSVNGSDGVAITWTVSAAGDYTVDVVRTAVPNCAITMNNTVSLTVYPLPTATATNDGPKCEGEDIILTGGDNGMVSYAWSGPLSYSSGDQSPTLSAVTPGMTGAYTLLVTDGNGCQNTAVTNVVVNTAPTGDISGTADICDGSSTDLTFTLTGVGPWDLVYTDGTTDFPINGIVASPHVVSVTPAVNTSYTIKSLSDSNVPVCAAAVLTGQADITVLSRPTSVISGDASICDGESTDLSIVLTGASDWDLTYTDGTNTFNETISSSPHTISVSPSAVPANAQTAYPYLVTALVDANGCVANFGDMTGGAIVIVNPIPNVTLVSDQAGDEFCAGTLVEFTAGDANVDEFIFYKNGIEVQARSTTATWSANDLVDGDQITVEGFDTDFAPNTDCSAISAPVTVVVNEVTATLSISSPGAVICAGTPVTFNANAVKTPFDAGATYNYEFRRIRSAVDTQAQDGLSSTFTDPALQNGDQIYVIITEANSGCDGTSSTITITVNDNPVVTLVPDVNPSCDGSDVTLTATVTNASPTVVPTNYEFFLNTVSQQSSASNTFTRNNFADGDQVFVEVTTAAGCNASSAPPVVISIDPLPTPTITGNFTPCVDAIERYTTDPGFAGSYVWTVTGGTFDAGGGINDDYVDVDWNTTGIQTLTVTYNSADGCPPVAPTSQTITVNSLPTVGLTGETDVCDGATETYTTETGMSNYVWNVVGGSIQTNDNNGTITVLWNVIGNGSVSVNYDNSNGCSANNPTVLATTVHTLPIPTITGNSPVCLNATERYSTEGGYTNYDWQVVGGTIIPTANPHIVDVQWTSIGNQEISVNYETLTGNCSAASRTTSAIFVNDLLVPTITGDNDVCVNSSGNIYTTEAGMTGYVWTVVGGTVDSGGLTNEVSVTWNTAGAQSINVSYTDGNTCPSAAAVPYAVNVNALPTPTITGDATVCNGTSSVYSTETGMTAYAWTVTGGGSISAGQGTESITVDWTAVGPQDITVTYIDANLCGAGTPTSTRVTVTDLPSPTITGSDDVCEGHTETYTTEGGASNYDWQIAGGTIIPTAQEHIVDVVWTLGAAREISVNYELSSCPAATPFVLPVTVNPIPTVSLTGVNEACLNTIGHIYTTDAGESNYQWTVVGGTVTAGLGTNEITVTWDVQGAGSVEVNYDNSDGCSAVDPSRIDVTVHPLPIPTLSGNNTVCNTYREVYTTETGMTNYNWLVSGGTIDVDDNNGTIEVIWNTLGAQTISVSYTNSNNCDPSIPTEINVTVEDTPVPTITGNSIVCNNNTEIYSTETGNDNYVWTITAGGTIVSGQGTDEIEVLWNATGAQQITVNYEFASGCTAPNATPLDITVNPLSGVVLTAAPSTSVVAGTEITFTATGTDVVNYDFLINGVPDATHDGSDSYRWTPADISDDNTVVRVIATTSTGCTDFAELTIRVFEGLAPTDVEPLTQVYCEGDASAVSIYLVAPVMNGVSYDLIRTDDSQLMGTVTVTDPSDEVRWTHGVNGVDFTYAGTATFKVEAYWPAVPGDRIDMNNQVVVIETALPDNSFTIDPVGVVTGCNAGAGYEITLSGSEADVIYTLTVDGAQVGTPIPGTGAALNFGFQLTTGVYVVVGDRDGCIQDMSGTFEIQSDWSGTTQTVVGNPADGRFCIGGAGIEVILEGSEAGTNYVVTYNGAEIIGSDWTGDGAANTFGPYDAAGDYAVNVKTTSGCYYPMSGLVTVTEVALPTAFNLLAENDNPFYCTGGAGLELLLDNKEAGVRYTLYKDGVYAEDILATVDGGQLVFTGAYTAGTYNVRANIEGLTCEEDMANTLDLVEDPLPQVLELLGETGFCEGGGSATLYINNPEADVTYELLLDGIATGDFGTVGGGQIIWSATAAGQYTVQATKNNASTNCGPHPMNGAIDVTMTLLPEDRLLTVVDGTDCDNGTIVTINSSQAGIRYVLIDNDTDSEVPGYEIIGDGGNISFNPIFDDNGSYRIEGFNTTCNRIIDDANHNPILVNIAGVVGKRTIDFTPSGPICVGDGGLTIQVHNPDANVDYVLYRIDGTGTDVFVETLTQPHSTDPIAFTPTFAEGEYKVIGYRDFAGDPTGCNNEMLNRLTISYNPLPKSYLMTGSGSYCNTGTGTVLGIEGSEIDYIYNLVFDDGSGNVVVDTKVGDGMPLVFDAVSTTGTYTVYAASPFGCTSSMDGSIDVQSVTEVINQDLTMPAYTYCANSTGVDLVLQDQEYGVYYEVREADGITVVLPAVQGGQPGSQLILGEVQAGTYTIFGSYDVAFTSCVMQINSGAEVIVTSDPVKPILSLSSTDYCADGDGVVLTVDNSVLNVGYQLINNAGDLVNYVNGIGGPVEFPVPIRGTETYFVKAISFTTGCEVDSDPITITENPLPQIFDVWLEIEDEFGDVSVSPCETLCQGSVNIDKIKLESSVIGTSYTLLRELGGDLYEIVSTIVGDGLELDFGVQDEAGYYVIQATTQPQGCSVLMDGRVLLYAIPLEAIDDVVGLQGGELLVEFDVAQNDLYLNGVDVFEDAENEVDKYRNLEFELITAFEFIDENGDPQQHEVIGSATINSEGKLEYKKLPGFYGRDSVRYRVTNIDPLHPNRSDIATVFIFVGNVNVEDGKDLLLPNAFSPNDDGINDFYVISGSFDVAVSKLEVFNRWGTLVYRSKGDFYGKDDDWWDGKSNAGAMVSLGDNLPNGTYYYVFSVEVNNDGNKESKEYSGFIELRR